MDWAQIIYGIFLLVPRLVPCTRLFQHLGQSQRFSHDWNLPALLKTAVWFLLGNLLIYYLEIGMVFIFKKN